MSCKYIYENMEVQKEECSLFTVKEEWWTLVSQFLLIIFVLKTYRIVYCMEKKWYSDVKNPGLLLAMLKIKTLTYFLVILLFACKPSL